MFRELVSADVGKGMDDTSKNPIEGQQLLCHRVNTRKSAILRHHASFEVT